MSFADKLFRESIEQLQQEIAVKAKQVDSELSSILNGIKLPKPKNRLTEITREWRRRLVGERPGDYMAPIDFILQIEAYNQSTEADGWQPISTAPRDGKTVDLWGNLNFPNTKDPHMGRATDLHWSKIANCWAGDEYSVGWGDAGYTHWRYPPAPPRDS